MKIRTGFVSNSSSSSFCICGCKVDDDIVKKIDEEYSNEKVELWNFNRLDFFYCYCGASNYPGDYLGMRYDETITGKNKDGETKEEFRNKVEEIIEKVIGKKIECEYVENEWER